MPSTMADAKGWRTETHASVPKRSTDTARAAKAAATASGERWGATSLAGWRGAPRSGRAWGHADRWALSGGAQSSCGEVSMLANGDRRGWGRRMGAWWGAPGSRATGTGADQGRVRTLSGRPSEVRCSGHTCATQEGGGSGGGGAGSEGAGMRALMHADSLLCGSSELGAGWDRGACAAVERTPRWPRMCLAASRASAVMRCGVAHEATLSTASKLSMSAHSGSRTSATLLPALASRVDRSLLTSAVDW
mmetsp:Transcript_6232/g.18103  ORF Transcript_6232/g.18103 Transcript_6232/m.18103 type:complete len:249 (-) Transcript_6232:496-1242(-)